MTQLLYLDDSYMREFDSTVTSVEGNKVILDRTCFYIGGGGQPNDTGILKFSSGEARVIGMDRNDTGHIIEGYTPNMGEEVHGMIDWDRRYRIMRVHTAVHVISGVAYRNFGVIITGNQLYEGRARLDLSFEHMDRELVSMIIEESNRVIGRDLKVKWYYITREEFKMRKELMRVSPHLYEKYEKIRVVEIEDFDVQADGGTHVRTLKEIGKIEIEKYQSKGKRNKRIYIRLIP